MQYALIYVSLVPLRLEPSDRSEMVSQLLFGEELKIIETKNNWLNITCLYDNYTGWIDSKTVKYITKPNLKTAMVFDLTHSYTTNQGSMPLTLGATLPNFDGLHFKINKKKYVFNGNTLEPNFNNLIRLKKIAIKYLNAPYLWGGRSPFGIDCSGFTQMVFKFLNIKLPRDAYQQAELGTIVNFVQEAILGDLAFFKNDEERIIHVGIILEQSEIIHAHGKVRIDRLDHIGIFNKEMNKYTHKLATIKRLV